MATSSDYWFWKVPWNLVLPMMDGRYAVYIYIHTYFGVKGIYNQHHIIPFDLICHNYKLQNHWSCYSNCTEMCQQPITMLIVSVSNSSPLATSELFHIHISIALTKFAKKSCIWSNVSLHLLYYLWHYSDDDFGHWFVIHDQFSKLSY